MKIKIIEPYDFNPRYDQRSLTPNPGPVVVATLIAREGHCVEVLSEYVGVYDIEEMADADLVGISITTTNAARGFEIARRIEQPVVFGGFHASLMPEECLRYGEYVIKGDGYPLVDLTGAIESGEAESISHIPNLIYKNNGKVVYNRSETKAVDIVPDFNLVRDYYRFNARRLLRIPLLVNGSRGCSFECKFCSIKAVYPDFKRKSVRTVVEDIKSQVRHQHFFSRFLPRIIWITDDNFTSDRKWARELLEAIASLNTKYWFTIQVRVDVARDDELLELMKKAHIGRVYLGIESLRQESLVDFEKKTTLEDVEHAVGNIQKHGIDVHGLFVFGDDAFQKGDGGKVAQFVKEKKLSGLLIQPLTPFPGTPMANKLESQKRLLHKNWRWYGDKVVFRPVHMTPAELQKELYDCYREVFSITRVLKFLICGQRGFKLELLGEALYRLLERKKMKRYIREKLKETKPVSAEICESALV
jgi:radical SAM superfamily enzyme YgiQ (UPF0313 family)